MITIDTDLSCLQGKEMEDNWRQRDLLLKRWTDGLLNSTVSTDLILVSFKGQMEHIASILMSPRTQIILTASSFMQALFVVLGNMAQQLGGEDALLSNLLKTSSSVKKIVAGAALEALKLACVHLGESRVFQHLQSALNDKNSPILRLRAAQALGAIYRNRKRREAPWEFALLLKTCSDPDGDVRLEAAILLVDCLPEDKRDAVFDKLDGVARRQLWRTIERYRSMSDVDKENLAAPLRAATLLVKPREIPREVFRPTPIKALDKLEAVSPNVHLPGTPTPLSQGSYGTNISQLLKGEKGKGLKIIDDDDDQCRDSSSIFEGQDDEMILVSSDNDNEVILQISNKLMNSPKISVDDHHQVEQVIHVERDKTPPALALPPTIRLTTPAKSSPLAPNGALNMTPVHQIQHSPINRTRTETATMRPTPKSTSKLPLRLRLGLASSSPYAQQQLALKCSECAAPTAALLHKLTLDLDDMEAWQKLTLSTIDDAVIDFLLAHIRDIHRDSLFSCIGKVLCSYLSHSSSIACPKVLEALCALDEMHRLSFMEYCMRAFEKASFDTGVLEAFVASSPLVDHIRAMCLVKIMHSEKDAHAALSSVTSQLLLSLHSANISHRQAAASCLRAAYSAIQDLSVILACFSDASSFEKRLIQTYCTL